MSAPQHHPGRTEGCPDGCAGHRLSDHRTCTCTCTRDRKIDPPVGMWEVERANPGRAALLYVATITLALIASHFWPWGCA